MIGEAVSKLHQKTEFEVEIDDIDGALGFSKVGPFKLNISEAKYKPGGAKIPHKDPTTGEFENITFERAATSDQSVYEWAKECLDWIANSAFDDPKRNATVTQLDRTGKPVVRYRIFNAYIVEYEPGDFEGGSDDYTMEKFVLSVESWDRIIVN